MDRDSNRGFLTGDYPFRTKRSITFDGATADAWGNDGGALDGGAIFTVTGLVQVKVIAEITTSLTGASATLAVGIAASTAIFMAAETGTDLDAGNIWLNDTTQAAFYIIGEEQAAADNWPEYVLNGQDIILTIAGGANAETGVIDFFALWKPLSDDGSIIATTD